MLLDKKKKIIIVSWKNYKSQLKKAVFTPYDELSGRIISPH